ncbi:MAG: hypothetical protein GY822_05830, partial [Deltaproteobacteria bacterium]|nr:hypothetical protein [Deltaproteobacteria bacterium]
EVYTVVWVDALRVNSRQTGVVKKHAVYLVMGMNAAGERSVLGMWTQQEEGATFWMSILDNLKKRGVNDILFLRADGLTGISQAVESIYPKSLFQTCMVHMIRSSVSKAPYSGIHAGLMQSRCPGRRFTPLSTSIRQRRR